MKRLLFLIVLLFSNSVFAQDTTKFKMSDFMGINTNVASYDQKYIDDLARCVKWIREYHSWAHYEVADNYYRWDNITRHPHTYTWPDHNKFMDECQRLGVNVLIDVLNKPAWAGSDHGAYSVGNGSKATDYLDKLEFMGQLVARYGAQKIDNSLLETTDKVSGLNYIKYYEDDNEQDYWWWNPKWPANNYALYCNAVHDAYGVETNEDYPLLGIKSVDSTAMHVLGGLAANNVNYLQAILNASNGRIPFDVLNIHTYCKDNSNAYSPENESYGLEKNLNGFMDWCGKNLPGIPVWITEFGWDTYLNNNVHSYIYAPAQQQANYILRSFLISLKMGFEKAFLFMGRDPNSTSTLQYSSSGIISDQNSGLAKKPSYYYLATMQNVLGDATLNEIVSYRELLNNNEVYCFEFLNEKDEKVYALWTREKNSKTDNGGTLEYSFDIGYQAAYAQIIHPKDKLYYGVKTDFVLSGSKIDLTLTETPQFLVVSQTKTSAVKIKNMDMDLKVFPNPADNMAQVCFNNPEYQNVQISVFASNGTTEEILLNESLQKGKHQFTFGNNLLSGLYFVQVKTNNFNSVEKVLIR